MHFSKLYKYAFFDGRSVANGSKMSLAVSKNAPKYMSFLELKLLPGAKDSGLIFLRKSATI